MRDMNLNITDFDLGTLWLSLSLREAALYCEHNAPLVPWRKRDAASVEQQAAVSRLRLEGLDAHVQ